MKNIKIFPKDWLQLHPYKQSTPVDSYYTGIANRIYDIMIQTELANSFEGEETKQISIRLAAYFEDVISNLGIWRAFITTYKELYDKYVPFYTPDDHYYDDEVNREDVRFLLWHFTQQYHGFRKGTFVNPDNPANEETARRVYQLFCDEWTVAPENEKMALLFAPETRYENQETYEPLLFWFHYNSYLLTDSSKELTEQTQILWNANKNDSEKLNTLVMDLHQKLAYVSKTVLLALTSPQWLARILPENHPDIAFVREIANSSLAQIPEEVQKKNQDEYEKFNKAAEGQLLIYFSEVEELIQFITEKAEIEIDTDLNLKDALRGKKLALYATAEEGMQVIFLDVELLKDEKNPFYDAAKAETQALAFFIVKHCSIYLLKELEEKGMLADAQTKSLISPDRGKAVIHENWQFLSRYFLREYPKM